ncbi:MAG: enterotoxin [Acidobacteria bacterium]|nr:enterotoxin [Acidobacteriota bacterium]
MLRSLLRYCCLLVLTIPACAQNAPQLTLAPGQAEANVAKNTVDINNAVISARWQIGTHGLRLENVRDKLSGKSIAVDRDVLTLVLRNGRVVKSSKLRVAGTAKIVRLQADPNASRLAEHFPGQEIELQFEDKSHQFEATWHAILRDGSNYIRQEITISALRKDLPLAEVRLVSVEGTEAQIVGSVKGSPVVAGGDFIAFEHPLSACSRNQRRLTCGIERQLPLRAGQQVTYSSVIGVTRPGQLRRDFLAYVERERAHPYRTFLHYNTWYDLGYFGRFDEAGVLDRIRAFGEELTQKRGVTLDSFLFDDGWDDPTEVWHFNSGFPTGFNNAREAAAKYRAAPGVWLSPWGGYGQPKQQRLESARKLGFETYQGGLALSGTRYFEYFRQVCLEMIDRYAVNQFKFDGTGNADRVIPGSRFDSDFDAAITLISDLRAHKPDLYVNLTTGTYPSPFWLRYADSIWRGGEDHDFAGVGTARQRWITYRDGDTYQHVVKAGPLFPLNSLMLHGLIYAQHAKDLDSDPGHDFADEIHSYFGTGTQLQEMYVTPSLLSADDWDVLATAAKWSRENATVLKDTHWIGGDPMQLQVYGWAAWTEQKGIVTLRNPSNHEQAFVLNLTAAFELTGLAPQRFRLRDVWAGQKDFLELPAAQPHAIHLKPFEVLTLEGEPVQ